MRRLRQGAQQHEVGTGGPARPHSCGQWIRALCGRPSRASLLLPRQWLPGWSLLPRSLRLLAPWCTVAALGLLSLPGFDVVGAAAADTATVDAARWEYLVKDAGERARIEQALPARAPAQPRRPRQLLIYNGNVGYGGHPSSAHASLAVARMGEKTGAYATVVSTNPSVFRPESLRRFDAVFFNNNVGNLFEEPALRQSLIEFIVAGGGLLGVHGTSVAFTQWPGAVEDWPEFGLVIGGRGANHRENTEHVFLKLDDPGHPLVRCFGGQGFDFRDEFFRVHEPYSRDRLRVLLSFDTVRTDMNQGPPRGDCVRADNDYAVAWAQGYGRGRAFYCTIAHNPYVFWDRRMLEFYLAAVQFALGDLDAPTTPSSRLTPATLAQEKLGWRLGLQVDSPAGGDLSAAIQRAAALGVGYLGADGALWVGGGLARRLNPELTDAELGRVRLLLGSAGVRLLTYTVSQVPTNEPGWRRVFAFARKLGVEALVAEPALEQMRLVGRLCDEFDIRLAVPSGNRTRHATFADPRQLGKTLKDASPRLGVCANLDAWQHAGTDPVRAVRALPNRLVVVEWQRWDNHYDRVLRTIRQQTVPPVMFGGGLPGDWPASGTMDTRALDPFQQLCVELAK